MKNFVLDSTANKNYEKEDQPLMSLERDFDSSSTTSGSTTTRCSSTTSRSTRKSSICSTCDSSDTDSGSDEENK